MARMENFALEFRDLQATTLSIDKNGELALLAGRKYLAVLSLEETMHDKLIVRVPYGGKYEISNTQWGKGNGMEKSVAIASSQRCDVFELTDSAELKCSIRLKGHTRVITDLDWSSIHPSLLATSSFDSFVHIWDIRVKNNVSADKPQFSLSALDGASQVRWNRESEDILASCDGGHVKIWDLRKPNVPSEFIAAHASKINGLEWANLDTVITAAQDCTVKFSKLSAETPNKAKGPILSLTAPVWRARPAPFGRGVVTQCVPILRRDSGLLSLWDWKRFASPIFTFQAYDIIEFAWRKTQNFDLITWSRDQTLRVWTLPRELVQLCGGDEGNTIPSTMTSSNDEVSFLTDVGLELSEDESPPSSPHSSTPVARTKKTSTSEKRHRKSSSPGPLNRRDTLRVEYEKLEQEKPENINFDQVEMEKGLLRFSWTSKVPAELKGRVGVTAGILASFPTGYPAAAPTFLVTNASHEVDKNHVVKSLKTLAQQYSKRNEQCLAKCVEQFAAIMSSLKTLDDVEQGYFPNLRGVSNVPFPRTSGARFCAVGMLICFGRPSYLRKVKSNCDAGTPRALSALGPYLSQVALENEDSKYRKNHHHHHHRRHERKRAGLVTLFDVSPLLPFNFQLAEGYRHIICNPPERKFACELNANVATAQKKTYVANVWQACSIISGFAHPVKKQPMEFNDTHVVSTLHDPVDDEDESIEWLAHHPLGCELLHSMITHCAKYGDVQTAATVAGLFTSREHLPNPTSIDQELQQYKSAVGKGAHRQTIPRLSVPKWWTKGVGSPYHTVHGSDTLNHSMLFSPLSVEKAESLFRQQRSNSWSDVGEIQLLHSDGYINGAELQLLHNANASYHSSTSSIQIVSSNGHNPSQLNYHRGLRSSNSHSHSISEYNGNGGELSISKPFISVNKGIVLDCNFHRYYDRYKKSYAEILYRWGLLQQRAEVLKNLTEISEGNVITRLGVDFSMFCKKCGKSSKGPYCFLCKQIISICSICHIPVKGLSTFCPICGHGGHASHMMEWFKIKKTCPTGCGCICTKEDNFRN